MWVEAALGQARCKEPLSRRPVGGAHPLAVWSNHACPIPRGVDPLHYGYGYDPPPDWRVGWERDMPMLAGRFVLTLPARISPRKGQDDFLALIAALRERGIPAHGLLAGGTDRPERLSALIGDMLWAHRHAPARRGA